MINEILLAIGGILVFIWGMAHLFPTRGVIKGFGNISEDNKRILLMEWVNEGLTLIFVGILIVAVTFLGEKNSATQQLVYLLSACLLVAMAVLSALTGARVKFLPYRLCPFIFMISAILIIIGSGMLGLIFNS